MIYEKPTIEPLPGFRVMRNNQAVQGLELHYSADPDKREGTPWWNRMQAVFANMMDKWRREYEIDYTTAAGDRVFPNFSKELHQRNDLCRFNPDNDAVIYEGWDNGFKHPAWCLVSRDADDRFYVLGACLGYDATPDEFFTKAVEPLRERLMANDSGKWPKIKSAGDHAMNQRQAAGSKGARSMSEILRQFGVKVRTVPTPSVADRHNYLRNLMSVRPDGTPGVYFSDNFWELKNGILRKTASKLIEGFEGGFVFQENSSGESVEKFDEDGIYSHNIAALEYIFLVYFRGQVGRSIRRQNKRRRREKGPGAYVRPDDDRGRDYNRVLDQEVGV